ncbi:MAG: acyloxyacyl hydrolase [Hyphomonadaceae bacterium]|nr:acyloxyacyl hydrolase [Hyphomonadaceae bacterium]
MKRIAAGVAALGAVLAASPAEAGVAKVNFGALAHNIQVIDPKNAHKEKGPDVELQIDFDSPSFLPAWTGEPTPYVMASVNTRGRTSFAGFGLAWSFDLPGDWSFDPSVGYVVHSGDLENPYFAGDPRYDAYYEDHLLLGSRDLFRTTFGLTHHFNESWSTEFIYSHLSHGQILGSGRNQGLDSLGMRVGYRFGG